MKTHNSLDEQRGHDAHERHKEIMKLKLVWESSSLQLGHHFYWLKKNKEYLDLDYPTFYSYLHAPDTDFNASLAYQLIRVYEKYVLELDVDQKKLIEVGYSKLDILKEVVTRENVYEKLENAIPIGRGDLRIERDTGNNTLYEENVKIYSDFYVWGIMEEGLDTMIRKFPAIRPELQIIRDLLRDAKTKLEAENG